MANKEKLTICKNVCVFVKRCQKIFVFLLTLNTLTICKNVLEKVCGLVEDQNPILMRLPDLSTGENGDGDSEAEDVRR